MNGSTRDVEYKSRSLRILALFFAVWLFFAVLVHIPVDELKGHVFNGAGLHWWFATQWSIAAGIVVAFLYAYAMNRLDEEFGVKG